MYMYKKLNILEGSIAENSSGLTLTFWYACIKLCTDYPTTVLGEVSPIVPTMFRFLKKHATFQRVPGLGSLEFISVLGD